MTCCGRERLRGHAEAHPGAGLGRAVQGRGKRVGRQKVRAESAVTRPHCGLGGGVRVRQKLGRGNQLCVTQPSGGEADPHAGAQGEVRNRLERAFSEEAEVGARAERDGPHRGVEQDLHVIEKIFPKIRRARDREQLCLVNRARNRCSRSWRSGRTSSSPSTGGRTTSTTP